MQQFVLDYRSSKIKDHEICLITFNETDIIGTTQWFLWLYYMYFNQQTVWDNTKTGNYHRNRSDA